MNKSTRQEQNKLVLSILHLHLLLADFLRRRTRRKAVLLSLFLQSCLPKDTSCLSTHSSQPNTSTKHNDGQEATDSNMTCRSSASSFRIGNRLVSWIHQVYYRLPQCRRSGSTKRVAAILRSLKTPLQPNERVHLHSRLAGPAMSP
jgi:hypothetical protein